MKSRYYIVTVAVCAAVLLVFAFASGFFDSDSADAVLKVGFIYSEDESTPYTYNFVLAQRAVAEEFGDRVEILSQSNVNGREAEEPLRDLVRKGCRIIFVNLDTDAVPAVAAEYPRVQFCQVSLPQISLEGQPENYHTFNGEIYEARYVAGIVAGMKLNSLIEEGALLPGDAKVGYVAANDSAEVVSGYTAFLLGIRSVAPDIRLHVRYTGSWSNYSVEKETARKLIDEGCVIIAQHTNTMAPAVACEEAYEAGKQVYHIGYHQSMMDIAPSAALVSLRTNWIPYIVGATEAVMKKLPIERHVKGQVHGRDISAGFSRNWVQMLELNPYQAAPGTEEQMNRAISQLSKGRISVFQGSYTGVNPEDPTDTVDLSRGYKENEHSSSPSFRYILDGCVVIEENEEEEKVSEL